MECVFSHVWARLASEDAVMCVFSLWDTVQRRPAGNTHVQQHRFLSRRPWDHRLRYVNRTFTDPEFSGTDLLVLFSHSKHDEGSFFIHVQAV